jgi:hypothetical protein
MPVNIYELQEDRKTFLIDKYQLTVTYRPNELTPARELAMLRQSAVTDEDGDDEIDEQIRNAERNINRQIEALIALIESWDCMGPLAVTPEGELMRIPRDQFDDAEQYVADHGGTLLVPTGHPIPLRHDCLVLLGSFFLTEVMEAINKDLRPDPKKRKR